MKGLWAGISGIIEKNEEPSGRGESVAAKLLDKRDCILDSQDFLGHVVGNVDTELLLEPHDELDRVETLEGS